MVWFPTRTDFNLWNKMCSMDVIEICKQHARFCGDCLDCLPCCSLLFVWWVGVQRRPCFQSVLSCCASLELTDVLAAAGGGKHGRTRALYLSTLFIVESKLSHGWTKRENPTYPAKSSSLTCTAVTQSIQSASCLNWIFTLFGTPTQQYGNRLR